MRFIFWLLLFVIIFIRIFSSQPEYPEGERVRIKTRIVSEPIRYENSQRVITAGLVTYLPLYPEINYGDKIVVLGAVVGDKLKDPKLIAISKRSSKLFLIRNRLVEFYKKALPEPHSSLVAGYTIGSKSEMPPAFWESLKISGTAHVVVASGMNVSLVGGFLMTSLVAVLPRKKAIPLALTGIWIYSVIAGFDAPIIRAAIMGSIAFTAQEMGRLNYSLRALTASALLMLIIRPVWINDLGFLLSFASTLAIILFEPKVKKAVQFLPSPLKEDVATTTAAQVGVAPILFFTFGQFNPMSIVANALVLWTVVPVTVIGMIAGIVGLVLEPIGKFILLAVYPLTWWFIFIVKVFG
jgi:competence protein ComEC